MDFFKKVLRRPGGDGVAAAVALLCEQPSSGAALRAAASALCAAPPEQHSPAACAALCAPCCAALTAQLSAVHHHTQQQQQQQLAPHESPLSASSSSLVQTTHANPPSTSSSSSSLLEPSAFAASCAAVLERETVLLQALHVCARADGAVVAFVQSGLCPRLVRVLEACLEAAPAVSASPAVALVLGLLETLLASPAFCDALAGSPELFLLLTLPVREAAPHNQGFSMSCARLVYESVLSWGPAVVASMADQGWIGFVLARIDSDFGGLSGELAVLMADTVARALQRSAGFDGQLLAVFAQQNGFDRLVSMMHRFSVGSISPPPPPPSLPPSSSSPPYRKSLSLELMQIIVRLVYVGCKPLKEPEESPFLLNSTFDPRPADGTTTDRRRSVSIVVPPKRPVPGEVNEAKRVRNPEAVAALQKFFISSKDHELQAKTIDSCYAIFAAHPQNYLLLQQQHTFAEFIEQFDHLPLDLSKRVLDYLVLIEEELHYVPFHELMNLSLLLDKEPNLERTLLVYKTVRRLVERNAQYKSYLEQAGLLHISAKLLKMLPTLAILDWNVYNVLLDILTLLLTESPPNCQHFLKNVGNSLESVLPAIEQPMTRQGALKLVQILMVGVPEKSGTLMNVLMSLLRNSKDDRQVITDTLVALSQLMANRWPVKEAFRETGGFVTVMSLLMALEGAFDLAHTAKETDCVLLVTIFDTCTAAVAGHSDNREFFCRDILPSIVASLKLTGVLVTGREARLMLLAMFRLLTENKDFLSGQDATAEYRRYCTVKIGEVALVLIALIEHLNDENKFYLLDCLSDIVWGLYNKEVFAQHQVLSLTLRLYEDLLCRQPNKLVNRLIDFMVRLASHRLSHEETICLFRLLRRHAYPAHLMRAMRRMTEKSRTPHLIEFNLAALGFANLKLLPGTLRVAAGYSWPPANGWTLAFWICVEDFGQHSVDIVSLNSVSPVGPAAAAAGSGSGFDESGDAALGSAAAAAASSLSSCVFKISITPSGQLLYGSSTNKTVEMSSFKFESRKWHHVVICWQKKRFSSPEVHLFLDGGQSWIGSVPTTNYVNVDQLTMVCGTSMEEKSVGCKQLWWLGPLYLLDDFLDPKVVLTMHSLGPGYYFNFQGSLAQFQVPGTVNLRSLDLVEKYQFPSPIGCLDLSLASLTMSEERLVVALHARSLQTLPGTDTRILKNASPCRALGVRGDRAFGDVLMLGGTRAFENQGLAHSLHKVGGAGAMLVMCAEAQDSFLDALRLTVALIQSSWRTASSLNASDDVSYDMLAHAMVLQSHRLSAEAVDILWELVGLRLPDPQYDSAKAGFVPPQSPRGSSAAVAAATPASPSLPSRVRHVPKNGVVSNCRAFEALFLSFVPWKASGNQKLQLKVFEDMSTLIRDNLHARFNMWTLMKVNAVPRVLATLCDESVSVELFPSAIHFISLMLRMQPAAVMEQLTLFLLSIVPQAVAGVGAGDKTTMVPPLTGGRRRGMTGMTQSDQDVMRIVSLRNMLLEMLHAEVMHDTGTYESLISPEWLSNWTHRNLHSSSRLIGLRLLATMLSCSTLFAKAFQRTGWKWLSDAVSSFQLQAEVVYLLMAIVYGLPASSVPTKVRQDMLDLHTLFAPEKLPVVNAEAFASVLVILKSYSEVVYEKLVTRAASSAATFVPIKMSRGSRSSGSDSDDDEDVGRRAAAALTAAHQQQQQRPVTPKSVLGSVRASVENLLDRTFDRQPDLSALGVLCKYLLQAQEQNESFRNVLASEASVDRLVGLLFIRNNVNVFFGSGIVPPGVAVSSLSRDKVTFAELHQLGRQELQLIGSMVHFWIRNDPRSEQKVLDLMSFVPPETSASEAHLFTSTLMTEILLKLKQNITLKELESSSKIVDGISRFCMFACDLAGMNLFPGGERVAWECLVEVLELGESLLSDGARGGLLRLGKSKISPLFKPLNRCALALLGREDSKLWIVGQLLYNQRLVINHANDDKVFLYGLVHFLSGFLLADERELRDGSMALFKLLLIVWEGVMKECLVLPARSGVAGVDLITNGFDRLMQGVNGFQDWLTPKMELVMQVLSETASKSWSRALLQEQKTLQDLLKSFRLKQQRNSVRRVERDGELRAVESEFDASRKLQQERCRTEWILPRKRDRTSLAEAQQFTLFAWQRNLRLLEGERGIWGPDESQHANQRWKLAFVEGAYHMRLRLEPNDGFYLPPELLLKQNSDSSASSPSRLRSRGNTFDSEDSSPSTSSDASSNNSSILATPGSAMMTPPNNQAADWSAGGGPFSFGTRTPVAGNGASSPRFSSFASPESPGKARNVGVAARSRTELSGASSSSDTDSLSASPHGVLTFSPPQRQDGDEDEAVEPEMDDKDEEAKLDRLQRFLDGNDKVHFRSMFNVGRIQGMTKTPALLLVCRDSVYVVDDYQVDLHSQEIVEVERGRVDGFRKSNSGPNSRSASPANVTALDTSPSSLLRQRSASLTSGKGGRMQLGHDSRKWAYGDITDILQKRYLLQNTAIELFSVDGRNELLSFASRRDKTEAWKQLNRAWSAKKAKTSADEGEDGGGWRKMSMMVLGSGPTREDTMTHRWRSGLVSNFEYLMFLNSSAGRSYNDLTQYPVFPWILADYESAMLNLSDPSVYRDLSKPMGAQSEERAKVVRERFADYDPAEHDTPAFHYGTHYSSAAAVLYYLIRQEPFTSQFLFELQGGHFDHADRTFCSIVGTWKSAAGMTNSTSDVKELIPEFFVSGDFLRNSNRLNLGSRTGGNLIDHVELPPWACNDPALFVIVNRMALESEYVSLHLHEWIDLIFGYKQRGPEAVESLNVFHHLSYEGEVNVDDIQDPVQRKATQDAIFNFGQTPRQLFFKPHAPRVVTDACKGGLDHPFSRLSKSKANLSFELTGEVGFPVRRLQNRGGNTIGVCRSLQSFAGNGVNKLIRCDGPDHSLRLLVGGVLSDAIEGVHDGAPTVLVCCGEHVATGGVDGVVAVSRVVQRDSGARLEMQKKLVPGHRASCSAIAVSQVWNVIVSAAADQSILLWDLRSFRHIRSLTNLGGELSSSTAWRGVVQPSSLTCICIDEKNGNIACGSSSAISLYNINGDVLASVSLVAATPAVSVCFVDAQFSVLGAVTLVSGHQDGTVRLFRLDSTHGRGVIKSGAGLEQEIGTNPQSTPHPMMLSEVYAYTAHSSPISALLMLNDGMLSADLTGKVVRAFSKESGFPEVDFVLKPTE